MLNRPIRLAVLSRQEVIARGLTAMLSDYPDRVIVTALPGARSRAAGVEVVLYDALGLHNSDGTELDHLIHATQAKIVLYSRDMRPDLRARALAQGCTAWISMSARAKELLEAIELALDGVRPPEAPPGYEAGLSPREVETLALITQGLSNEEIVQRLYLSANTLKSHIRQCYRKIGVTTRAQAVGWAVGNGFIPFPPGPSAGILTR